MAERILYTYYRSSASYRTRIALNLKGLAYEPKFIHLRKGEQFGADYVKLNPQQQVPTLIDEGRVLIQSPAILEYLEEAYPTTPLLPRDIGGRARVRAIAAAIGCDIHPINNLRVLVYLKRELKLEQPTVDDWVRNWIRLGFTAIETLLAESGNTGTYCHGDHPTLADVYLAPQVYNAERFNYPVADHPTLKRVYDNAMKLDAFKRAYPENQPDAE
ncbi:MAG TPA: maleylacetoacetate isomerase [Alphaproteobacteria bacterium]